MDSTSFDNQGRAVDREQMMSLLSAASSMKTENNGSKNQNDGKNSVTTPVELEEDVPMTFPQRLMEILSSDEIGDVVSWLPHGKGFLIYKKKKFAAEILPVYFKQSKFTSFTRKLNRWGFTRVTRGPETGAYYHKYFQRGDLRLCMQMSCQSSKHQQLPVTGNAMNFGQTFGSNQLFQSVGNTLGAGSLAGGNFGGQFGGQLGNQEDIAHQNQSLIRHQLQQLQMQQMQLQQLQMQQQQQYQAAELMRHALSKQNGGDDAGDTKTDPSALFLQSLQRAKESGNGLLGSHQQLALLPNHQASQNPTAMGEPTRPAAGNGRAWAA